MRNRLFVRADIIRPLLATGLALALALTLSCGEHSSDGGETPKPKDRSQLIERIRQERENNFGGINVTVIEQDPPGSGDMVSPPSSQGTYVGIGINVFNGPTIYDATKARLFKTSFYQPDDGKSYNDNLEWFDGNKISSTFAISDNFEETFQKLDIDASVGVSSGGKTPFFSAKVTGSYSDEREVKSKSKFYTGIYKTELYSHCVAAKYKRSIATLKELMDPDYLDWIDDSTSPPDSIFYHLGTHVILKASMGGSARITAVYNSDEEATSEEIKTGLDFKVYWVNGKFNSDYAEKQKKVTSQTTIKGDVSGGILVIADIDSLGKEIDKWPETVIEHPTVSFVYEFRPIWDFASTEARKNELRDAFLANSDKINLELANLFQKTIKDGDLTDSRDGKKYRVAKIGTQTWMGENMNYYASGSKCYDNDNANCAKYGRLYNWADAKSVCPSGWHLPSDAEWNVLMKYVNPSCTDNKTWYCAGAGTKLKATSGWCETCPDYIRGTDDYGFSALPGGLGYSEGGFFGAGTSGYWWSSTELDASSANLRSMVYNYQPVYYDSYVKNRLFSVRCVKD